MTPGPDEQDLLLPFNTCPTFHPTLNSPPAPMFLQRTSASRHTVEVGLCDSRKLQLVATCPAVNTKNLCHDQRPTPETPSRCGIRGTVTTRSDFHLTRSDVRTVTTRTDVRGTSSRTDVDVRGTSSRTDVDVRGASSRSDVRVASTRTDVRGTSRSDVRGASRSDVRTDRRGASTSVNKQRHLAPSFDDIKKVGVRKNPRRRLVFESAVGFFAIA
jgi:hypothetical protein